MRKISAFFFAIIIIILTAVSCNNAQPKSLQVSDGVQKIRLLIEEQKYIVHACGEYYADDGRYFTYTNSKEALQNCYDAGYRVCEIDFRITSDNKLVCTHEMDWIYIDDKPIDTNSDLETYLSGKVYGEFTPIWLDDIVNFIREHPDFYVVTDIKDDNEEACELIRQACPDLLDNFIVQIYHSWEYNDIKELGFNNIIFTLYRTSFLERAVFSIDSFATVHELVGFTFWYHWTDNESFFPDMCKTGVPMYVHTVNDETEMQHYYAMGISAIYTDVIDPTKFK